MCASQCSSRILKSQPTANLCSKTSRALTFANVRQSMLLALQWILSEGFLAHILKSQQTVTLYSKYARALTFENFCPKASSTTPPSPSQQTRRLRDVQIWYMYLYVHVYMYMYMYMYMYICVCICICVPRQPMACSVWNTAIAQTF